MAMDPGESMANESLMANARKPVVLTERGLLLIGGEQFPYPVLDGSIKIEPLTKRYNRLTLTLVVGAVTAEVITAEPDGEVRI